MADIEERAGNWAHKYIAENGLDDETADLAALLTDAYLAGAGQAQQDYVAWAKSKGWL